ncbi:MAG: hypothetical protein V1754_06590, partial [Pseudomonadota bacterium]
MSGKSPDSKDRPAIPSNGTTADTGGLLEQDTTESCCEKPEAIQMEETKRHDQTVVYGSGTLDAPPLLPPETNEVEKTQDPADLTEKISSKEKNTWLNSFQLFQELSQKLARLGDWEELASITNHALENASYATRMTRAGMLLDLARIYRDRLKDARKAEQTFAMLAEEAPATPEALDFLAEVYAKRNEWLAIYDLYLAAVQATWDPNERLQWTQNAANLANNQIGNLELAIKAWEQLWELGDAIEESARALSGFYRRATRWSDMAKFLRQQIERLKGAQQVLALRELAEVLLSGLQSPDEARSVLQQIILRSPKDPVATLQLARVYVQCKEWDELDKLGKQASSKEKSPEATDIQRLIAESLWQAGMLENAAAAYDRILAIDPTDREAEARKLEYLIQAEKNDELLELLLSKAEATDEKPEKLKLLSHAAQLAEEKLDSPERAIGLWQQVVTINSENLPAFEALARLHETLNDVEGLANALEGQLSLNKEINNRVGLLRRLGEHYAKKMGEYDLAEGCWKEILSFDPSDFSAREELLNLHRQRGDFEALNSSLVRQLSLTNDEERATVLCRAAAENADENLADPYRSVNAWLRLLDFCPLDQQALAALSEHYTVLGKQQELISVLEQRIRAERNLENKIPLELQIASLWAESDKTSIGAVAAYERVLRWDPTNAVALDSLVAIYQESGHPEQAMALLETAGTLHSDSEQRIELLWRCFELFSTDDNKGRFHHLRRLLYLTDGDKKVMQDLRNVATEGALWSEMAALLIHLASQQTSADYRAQLLTELAHLYEEKLHNPRLAFLAHQSLLLSSQFSEEVLSDLSRLARGTERYEDLLVILDRQTTPDSELEARKDVIRQRAQIYENELNDPLRAFCELQRLLELDHGDWEPLRNLELLAKEHGLWLELDATYTQLWEKCSSNEERIELINRREHVARNELNKPEIAFSLLAQHFRLNPQNADVLRKLTEDAETLNGWAWLLPLLEADQRSSETEASSAELSVIAALYEEKQGNINHAFALYSSAFLLDPNANDISAKLEELARKTNQFGTVANAYRMASSLSKGQPIALDLLRRAADICEKEIDSPEAAIDIHRRLLSLKEDEMPSLEVMIEWHRAHGEWRELRDRIGQWTKLAPQEEDRIPKLIEIAIVSEQHLADPQNAMLAYGEILKIDPEHAIAKQGLQELVLAITEPNLRLQWLQMQLKNAPPADSTKLLLETAEIQESDLGDSYGAIETLKGLVETHGAKGPGFERLVRLLKEQQRFEELIEVLRLRAEQSTQTNEKLSALDEAISICHEYTEESQIDLRENLYRQLLALRPTDREVSVRLMRLLRNAGRFAELAEMLEVQQKEARDPTEKIARLYELSHLYALNMKQLERAEQTLKTIIQEAPTEEGALLTLARLALKNGDLERYIELREQQLKILPPREGALVLCHLAEICDEHEKLKPRMIPFYRQARALDPTNVPAMEALKGIGRRLKDLRPAAALLPLEGERDLDNAERAERLKALGEAAKENDPTQAIEWFMRAVTLNPDNP